MLLKDQQEELKLKLDICQQALEQLAGDINDNLAQLAATIKLNLYIIQKRPNQNNEKLFEEIRSMLSELIKGLQNIAGDKVNSIILDLPKI